MRTELIALAFVVAGGCAKNTTGLLGQADSQSAGNALGTEIETGATTFGPMNTQASVVPANPCVTLSGDTSDPDADNIPTSATLTFACSRTTLGFTGMVTGTETVMDTQPTTIAWAFSATAALHSSLTGPGGGSLVSDRTGSFTATQGSAAGPFTLAHAVDVVTVLTAANGSSATIDETTDWNLDFMPQVIWTPGSVVVGGSLSATGTWDVTVGADAASATLATPTPLTLTPTCATRVTGGTITATYQGGALTHTITVAWTGCGARTVSYTER